MRLTVLRGVLFLTLLLVSVWVVEATEASVAVSPGDASRMALVENRCPTFSWGAVPATKSYELVVYRVGEGGEQARAVIREAFAGSATSWTPSLDRCLERGGSYAWTVRATGGKEASDWSQPSLFRVASGPSAAEFEEALGVVQRYLAVPSKAATEKTVEAETRSGSLPGLSGQAPEPLAPPPGTQMSVDGNVDAASFSGDGALLTALNPVNLSTGTAAIDISGTAAMASDLVGSACVSESELDFDPVTEAEMTTHGADADAHREHTSLEESAEIDTDIGVHAALPNVHHTPTVDTDTVLTEAQVESFVTNGPLDMANNPITNIGAVGTDFTATGGLTLSDDLALAEGETISNPSDEVIRFSDGTDAFDIDLSGSVSLVGAPGTGEFVIEGAPGSGGVSGTSVRIRAGAGDGASDGGGIYLVPGDGGGGGGAGGTVEVLGDLTAVSFIGDGSGLTGVASDTASDLACTDCVSETELDFETATDAELSAHVTPTAHHLVPASLPPSGAAGGDLAGSYPDPSVSDDSHGHSDATIDAAIARDAEVRALQTQHILCLVDFWRYWDMGDGTVLDCNTGLIWLKDASCADLAGTDWNGRAVWPTAQSAAAALASGTCGLADGSIAGQWRVPTIEEFCSAWAGSSLVPCPSAAASSSLIDSSLSGAPFVSNAAGTGLWTVGNAFVGVQSDAYWSATEFGASSAWYVLLSNGNVANITRDFELRVWPVREASGPSIDLATQDELDTHSGDGDAHREHATLEESAEIDSDIGVHAALPSVHHTPTVDTDTVLTEAQVESFVTNGPLDMANSPITNIGAVGTDFTATGGLTLSGDFSVDGNVGIGTSDPAVRLEVSGGNVLIDGGLLRRVSQDGGDKVEYQVGYGLSFSESYTEVVVTGVNPGDGASLFEVSRINGNGSGHGVSYGKQVWVVSSEGSGSTFPSTIVELPGEYDEATSDLLTFTGEAGPLFRIRFYKKFSWCNSHGQIVILGGGAQNAVFTKTEY